MRLLLCLCAVMIFSCFVVGCAGKSQLKSPDRLLMSLDHSGAWPAAVAWEQYKQNSEIDSEYYKEEDTRRWVIKTLEKNSSNPKQIPIWLYIPTPQEQWGYVYGHLVFTPVENFLPTQAQTESHQELLWLKQYWGID